MTAAVRVLVVDDQRLIRESIASLLSIQDGVEVVGAVGDGLSAVEQAAELAPDVVLMDVRMPGLDGVEATALLLRACPACRVVMLTTFDDEEYVVRALQPARLDTCSRTCPRGNSPARCAWPTKGWPSSTRRRWPGWWPHSTGPRPTPATCR